ncbi:glycosyl hydrolase family 18 protein [Paenibacillus doosanensis]|uniref:glycosyl hydrolase family 18 protein n=1 Tax=Paenibacillus doosanensis TaxID=1229154 RepID=UPI002180784F|nr:glycosyl hydrolase family 18 protein [Paenibacillus doosanensis]MCS7460657.1 glycosyl hydrolase family 18 protein [Paenibacillus doosanensis]
MMLASLGLLLAGSATAHAYESRLIPFRDVGERDWSAEPIYQLAAVQAIDGYADGGFRPLAAMSREEFIKMMTAASGAVPGEQGETVKLKDVDPERWSYPMIEAALQRRWVDALVDSDGNFQPDVPIRREEVAYALGAMLLSEAADADRKQWLDGGWEKERDARAFPDAAQVDAPLAPYAYYAVKQGMLEGSDSGLNPDASLSRQEAAAVIDRLLHRTASAKPLTVTGFYAIQSYNSIERMSLLDQVALGWWHLAYEGAGKAKLDSAGDPYKFNLPEGWEEVTAAADKSGAAKDLVVFANKSHDVESFLGDAAARTQFAESLAAVVNDPRYGFSGVCIDFEDLYDEAAKDDFTAFLHEVKAVLNGKKLTVAVPPVYYYKGYDLKAIGAQADAVILMAYNFLSKADRLPSAPLPLVAESVRDTLAAGVPKEKLILGIGKKTDQFIGAGAEAGYASPASSAVEERLKKAGVAQSLSIPYLNRHIQFTDTADNELFYEDADSIDRKIWVARYYGLKGVALWYMGQFVDSDWQRIAAVRQR